MLAYTHYCGFKILASMLPPHISPRMSLLTYDTCHYAEDAIMILLAWWLPHWASPSPFSFMPYDAIIFTPRRYLWRLPHWYDYITPLFAPCRLICCRCRLLAAPLSALLPLLPLRHAITPLLALRDIAAIYATLSIMQSAAFDVERYTPRRHTIATPFADITPYYLLAATFHYAANYVTYWLRQLWDIAYATAATTRLPLRHAIEDWCHYAIMRYAISTLLLERYGMPRCHYLRRRFYHLMLLVIISLTRFATLFITPTLPGCHCIAATCLLYYAIAAADIASREPPHYLAAADDIIITIDRWMPLRDTTLATDYAEGYAAATPSRRFHIRHHADIFATYHATDTCCYCRHHFLADAILRFSSFHKSYYLFAIIAIIVRPLPLCLFHITLLRHCHADITPTLLSHMFSSIIVAAITDMPPSDATLYIIMPCYAYAALPYVILRHTPLRDTRRRYILLMMLSSLPRAPRLAASPPPVYALRRCHADIAADAAIITLSPLFSRCYAIIYYRFAVIVAVECSLLFISHAMSLRQHDDDITPMLLHAAATATLMLYHFFWHWHWYRRHRHYGYCIIILPLFIITRWRLLFTLRFSLFATPPLLFAIIIDADIHVTHCFIADIIHAIAVIIFDYAYTMPLPYGFLRDAAGHCRLHELFASDIVAFDVIIFTITTPLTPYYTRLRAALRHCHTIFIAMPLTLLFLPDGHFFLSLLLIIISTRFSCHCRHYWADPPKMPFWLTLLPPAIAIIVVCLWHTTLWCRCFFAAFRRAMLLLRWHYADDASPAITYADDTFRHDALCHYLPSHTPLATPAMLYTPFRRYAAAMLTALRRSLMLDYAWLLLLSSLMLIRCFSLSSLLPTLCFMLRFSPMLLCHFIFAAALMMLITRHWLRFRHWLLPIMLRHYIRWCCYTPRHMLLLRLLLLLLPLRRSPLPVFSFAYHCRHYRYATPHDIRRFIAATILPLVAAITPVIGITTPRMLRCFLLVLLTLF